MRCRSRLPDGSVLHLAGARRPHRSAAATAASPSIDFKTGAPPGAKEVFAGFSPQLTLEAAMLMEGAFTDVPARAETPDLLYVHTSGGRKPLKPRPIETPTRRQPLGRRRGRRAPPPTWPSWSAATSPGEAAYLSRPYPKFAKRFSDYDHLARVKEWSLANAEGEEG